MVKQQLFEKDKPLKEIDLVENQSNPLKSQENELDKSQAFLEQPQIKILQKGIVLLKNFLTHTEQEEIMNYSLENCLFDLKNKSRNEKTKNMHMVLSSQSDCTRKG